MLLKNYVNESRPLMAWGQISLVLGLLLSMLSAGRFPTDWLLALLGSQSTLDMLQGFAAGLAGVLLGVSIVLNVRGLILYRSERQGNREMPDSRN